MSSATKFYHHDGEFRMHRGGLLQSPTLAYETWGELNEAKDNAVLVFTPSADQTAMHDALNAANARIVDGPMANGGYVIEIKTDDLQAGLDSLKANDAVVLAESLNAGEQP